MKSGPVTATAAGWYEGSLPWLPARHAAVAEKKIGRIRQKYY